MPVTATTTLPDTTGLSFDASVEDQLTALWNDVTDYGDYRVQHRESGTTTWTDDGTVPQSDTDLVISPLLDGEKYDIRVRAETEHVQSAWLQLSEITLLPAPGAPSVTGTTASSIDVSITDNADNEDGIRYEILPEKDNRYQTGFEASWTTDADLAPNTTTHTYASLKSNWKYKFRVTAYTEHVTATSSAIVETTAIDFQDGFTLVLEDGTGDKLAFKQDELQRVRLPNRHTVINEWEITVPEAPGLEDWTYSEAYVWYENARHNIAHQLLYRGEFEVPETTDSQGTTIVRGKDVTRKLKRGGANVTYSNRPYWDAIQDYFSTYLPAWTATITQPTPRSIETNKVVQNSIPNAFAPSSSAPFTVNANNNLELLQTCFTQEGEQPSANGGTITSNSSYSGGDALMIDASGEYAEWTFTPEFDIKAEDFRLFMRWRADAAQQVNITVNGDTWTGVNDGSGATLGWREFAYNPASSSTEQYGGPDFTAGTTYTVRLDAVTSNTGFTHWDVIGPADGRFSYTLDNTNGGSGGYLDGPEFYPVASLISSVSTSTFNVIGATVTTTIDDTSGGQKLEASNDGGASYYPQDGTEANTQSVTADFDANSSYGTNVNGRVTLSRYGSRTTATPQAGFNGQVMSAWELAIDTNDLPVIDSRELTGSHYKNIQSLCRDSRMRFVVDYAENSLPVDIFETGDVTKTASWTTLDHTRTKSDDEYANSVTAWGATDGSGNRLKAVAKDDDAISTDGQEIEAEPLFKPDLGKSDLKSLVRTRLADVLQNDDLTGTVDIAPKNIRPGFSYQVGELDGQTLPLESVEFRISREGDVGQLDFAGDTDLVSALTGISTEVSSVKDAF